MTGAGRGAARSLVVVSVGSNIDPERNLPRALELLGRHERLRALSRVWETEPVGSPGAPRFLNAAVLLETERTPAELRRALRRIEARLGRTRSADRNAPRPLDLDVSLVAGPAAAEAPPPDPELLDRPHVAYPAAEVAPSLRHPADGRTLAEIAAELGPPGEERELPGWVLPDEEAAG